MIVLVDTSAWSLAIRRNLENLSEEQSSEREVLARLVEEGRVAMIGPVRQELLSGIRNEFQFQQVLEYLRRFDDAAIATEDYEEAARIHNLCRARGVTGSAVDFLICAVAVRRNWIILTLDRDFERYAKHIPLSLLRAGDE